MKLCRFELSGEKRVGILQDNLLVDLTSSEPRIFSNIGTLVKELTEMKTNAPELIAKYLADARKIYGGPGGI